MIFREDVCDRFAPFDNNYILGGFEIFAEIVEHEAGVGETVEIIVNKAASAIWQGIRFGNSETGAGDLLFNTKAFSEATSESGLAGADITDEFNYRRINGCVRLGYTFLDSLASVRRYGRSFAHSAPR